MTNQRNLLFSVVLSALLLLGWDAAVGYLYPQPANQAVEGVADTPSELAAVAGAASGPGVSGAGLGQPSSRRSGMPRRRCAMLGAQRGARPGLGDFPGLVQRLHHATLQGRTLAPLELRARSGNPAEVTEK